MKYSFFKIVGVFSLVIAGLALIIALITGLTASSQFFGSADEDINQPDVSLNDFYQKNKSDDVANQDKGEDASVNSEAFLKEQAFFKKVEKLLGSIVKSFNGFAEKTDQGSVNPEGLEDYLIDNTEMMDRENYLIFLEELEVAASDLNDKAASIAELSPQDEKHIHWSEEFLPWFIDSYIADYSAELQRINNEKAQEKLDRASSVVTASIAAIAFMVFVFFTLIVLLVQIERNTRK